MASFLPSWSAWPPALWQRLTRPSLCTQPGSTVLEAQEGDPVPSTVHRSLSPVVPWPDISLPRGPPGAARHTLS